MRRLEWLTEHWRFVVLIVVAASCLLGLATCTGILLVEGLYTGPARLPAAIARGGQ